MSNILIDLVGPGARLAKKWAEQAQTALASALTTAAGYVTTATEQAALATEQATAAAVSATNAAASIGEIASYANTANTAAATATQAATDADADADAAAATLTAILSAIDGLPAGTLPVLVATRLLMAAQASPASGDASILLEAGRQGLFIFDSSDLSARVTLDPQQANYVPPASDTDGSSGAWVRVQDDPTLRAEEFGAAGDSNGTTGSNNHDAILAAIDNVPSSNAYQNISPIVTFSPGTTDISTAYRVGSTLDVHTKAWLKGRNAGQNCSGLTFESELVWPADTICIRNHNSNTETDTAASVDSAKSAQGAVYEGLTISQITQGTDLTAHGLWMRGSAAVRSCAFRRIAGNAIHMNATAGGAGAVQGDANNWRVVDTLVHSCGGDALYLDGQDNNAGYSLHLITAAPGVKGCGIYDAAGLGNVHIAPQLTGYGNGGVYNAGRKYQLIVHDLVSAIAPGSDPTNWRDIGAAGAASTAFPQWGSGTHYYAKLPFLITNHYSTIFGGYEEHGQVLSRSAGLVIGGNHSATHDTPRVRVDGPHGVVISHTGFGGRIDPVPGTALHTANGDYAYTKIGVQNDDNRPYILEHFTQADGLSMFWRWNNGDQWLNYFNQLPYWILTGPSTAQTLGRTVAQPYYAGFYNFVLFGNDDQGRQIDIGTAPPATGNRARGEFRFNRLTSAGGVAGWTCTAGHATSGGTWEPVGIVGAIQAAAQANSSAADVAALKADFNALLAKLRTSKLMAT